MEAIDPKPGFLAYRLKVTTTGVSMVLIDNRQSATLGLLETPTTDERDTIEALREAVAQSPVIAARQFYLDRLDEAVDAWIEGES